ncbi:unnamed protein product [Clonostachys byssicola]|uniref:Uncharacterized protein n=1 Tax=Clonostachys byssicola TaxID=160290 RepID=A0A9N9U988_9HYPO|nr:unnamed protein product [Clonostachys byssicola]
MHFIQAVVSIFTLQTLATAQLADPVLVARNEFQVARENYLAARDEYLAVRDLHLRGTHGVGKCKKQGSQLYCDTGDIKLMRMPKTPCGPSMKAGDTCRYIMYN